MGTHLRIIITQQELSNEYQHDRVSTIFKNLYIVVLWTKVASALDGLICKQAVALGETLGKPWGWGPGPCALMMVTVANNRVRRERKRGRGEGTCVFEEHTHTCHG